jgi:hypothetical protein
MKGYITKQGRVVFTNGGNGRAVGYIELANGKSAQLDMPIEQAHLIHLEDVPELLSTFADAVPFNVAQ